MPGYNRDAVFITGLGVTSAVGQGQAAFIASLLNGDHRFAVMRRPGRQDSAGGTAFLGAEIAGIAMPDSVPAGLLRTASLSARAALATLDEAWNDAALGSLDPERVGLVVGGSNIQQRELHQTYDGYRERLHFLRPTYGISVFDTDICGLCTEVFDIRGSACTVGGASASGQLAVIQAIQAVQSGQLDACVAIGALMDLSCWECQGFRSLGAMGSSRYADQPALACRPFDHNHDGFIYGEACGAVVVESPDSVRRRGARPHARVSGWATAMDGNRNPNPSFDGEVRVIRAALEQAAIRPAAIDYVNPHGTGSLIGDETEVKAIRHCGLAHARLNATKSITGHGLSAAGAVEIVATVLQMKERRLHPSRNLEDPIDASLQWVRQESEAHLIEHALNLSMGFGGINTAICLQRTS